jgi:hypothetical protein
MNRRILLLSFPNSVMLTIILLAVNLPVPSLSENATGGNSSGTVGNSTEDLTTFEERGVYSDYGGGASSGK